MSDLFNQSVNDDKYPRCGNDLYAGCPNCAQHKEAELERQIPQWQPISTAPKDGTACLVASPILKPVFARFSSKSKRWHVGHATSNPTVWMPLPPIPTKEAEPSAAMKAQPHKLIEGEGYQPCAIEECTHIKIHMPGPIGVHFVPVILRGRREGTGCWTWNGDTEKPTLRPSLLVTSGHYINAGGCWCDYNVEHADDPAPFTCYRCHSWITDGQAIFLDDCSHELRGQTIDLIDAPQPPPAEGPQCAPTGGKKETDEH